MRLLNFLFDPTKKLKKQVAEINALEKEIAALGDEEMKTESARLGEQARNGVSLDELLPQAFALVRETAKRTLGQRHFDVQLMGGIILHEGKIAEMATGEGKTLAATAPVYLNALAGKGVHVVTVNEYLAKRDTVWMGQIYHALGMSVACLVHEGALVYDPAYVYSPTDADDTPTDADFLYKDLTYEIRGALFEVKKKIGLGHKEGVYQNALAQELEKRGLKFEKEKEISVHYEDKKVGTYRPDFIIDNKVILELKALPFIGDQERRQLWTYLKGSEYKLALLANFSRNDIEIKRIIYDTARSSLRKSALSQRESALLDKERDATGGFQVQEEFLRPISRQEAYQADITYGTNHEFGFDYLRDNLAYDLNAMVQIRRQTQTSRGKTQNDSALVSVPSAKSAIEETTHNFAIIDEVDSILIDEARTPLIISAPDSESSGYYKTFAKLASFLTPEEDYTVDEKFRSVQITESGIDKVEKSLKINNIYTPENLRLVHYLEESLKAQALFKRDKDYVVKNNEVIIVDQNTGRLMLGRRYSGGLHQAIEAKEGAAIQQESRTYAQITIQNYFRLYNKLAGMTGTAQTSAEEFDKVYRLPVASIPTNKPVRRKDLGDVIYKTADAKFRAVAKNIKEKQKNGQPVLVGTISIEKNELLSRYLNQEGVRHEILNAKNNEREGAIIAQTGRIGAVTIATNMAGRGVDIILGGNPPNIIESEKVKDLGGLHVIGTERHDARRIDNQLRGRCGRQGDTGSSQFFLSLEDDLMRIFGGDRIKSLMETLEVPEDMPIEAGLISKAVSQAQSRVEGFNFDSRKHLLEYDDILNKQRLAIYEKRQKLLEETRQPQILAMLDLLWMNHLENMEALRESVRLRAYGQHEPLVEYRREGSLMFKQLLEDFEKWLEENAQHFQQMTNDKKQLTQIPKTNLVNGQMSNVNGQKVGRNDPCPCGSGKKYKRCHGK